MEWDVKIHKVGLITWWVLLVPTLIVGILIGQPPNLYPGLPLEINAYTIILTSCMLIYFMATHILVFTGKANDHHINDLALAFMYYSIFALIFATSPAGWVIIIASVFIFLGVEYLIPDWPMQITSKFRWPKINRSNG